MDKKRITKIHIIGSVGSGKTTLAKSLSSQLGLPYYELDNVAWRREPSGDIRRTEKERNDYLKQIIDNEAWIVEGVHHTWVNQSLEESDTILFLNPSYLKRLKRINMRFIRQKLGMEKANYRPDLLMLKKMYKWNAAFEKTGRIEIDALLSLYKEKVVELKDNKGTEKYFQ
ncbi:DNA topology modulation protein FlaR [Halobacillus sp. BBL2006]|uniref:DNA topology modulation protein FlaR n=1 Tax=Halobacillus sp. BBL2006 TaxID=1543706 RepID=UPI000541BF5E|nr:DNA topology modulation protein FlaR [Halobacillus sp. BBL2006]KHE71766.1 DNA topology modulation protein FlaR [Halobacillus sp. BBL2006]